ncbi:efflux RND transporter periplasmic adaptor subunit [Catalinimonas niigatensis]|uniref:efflux RND transporter periplasmic adaptor subunit n=1 Tax=Catalinimonas niigatensis TaxID=1397264 RepID=UPI0026662EB6|nr:efflux RND transporter periplasmic adaptor subunit [Catalinimonas niigatensis]WPP52200.1 efflux RND transporter periplasmic adaptor subunit [Catalinimonas niigatensis]
MSKKILIPIAVLAIAIGVYLFFGSPATEAEQDIVTSVKRTNLKIDVTVTGELQAQTSVSIMGPIGLRNAGIYQVKIDNIVPEGTVVNKGDYVARLDNSELSNKIREEELELQESLNKHEQTRIDTAINLRTQRDKLISLEYDMEKRKLELEQSQYEPPATIKQAELELEKAERALEQAGEEYELLLRKSRSEMSQANAKLQDDQMDLKQLQDLLQDFVIKAPENGMVIYAREWNGKKKGEGSQIGAWDPEVATLPDLSSMVSKTYVNEVDISRIRAGQQVEIGLDAFPDKRLTGSVTQVANVGEQRPNSDAKVFEISVLVNESDTTLRPAMTTGNTIITNYIENVLVVPLEAIYSQGDSLTYVFKRTGLTTVKQQIALGPKGNDMVVISEGLEEDDVVYLSTPSNPDEKQIAYLEEDPQPLTDKVE